MVYKRSGFRRILVKGLKISGITAGALLLLLFLLPYLFPYFVSDKIRQWAKGSIQTELDFSYARLSFFRHFPALTLTLYQVKIQGSAPFEKQTLLEAGELSLGVDIRSVFSELSIDKIFLDNASVNIQVDSSGHPNYNIYASKSAKAASSPDSSAGASLKIKRIHIKNSHLQYNDLSVPLLLEATDLNYEGSGDLSQAIFDLQTHLEIGSMDFYYNKQPYFLKKKLNADLVTRINTSSLALYFEQNDLHINQASLAFTGRFEFLKDGYNVDLWLSSTDADLHDMLTALPPGVVTWLSKTRVNGKGDINAALKGRYSATTKSMPDLTVDLRIRDGLVASNETPSPVKNLLLDLKCRLPGLNTDSLFVSVDSLFFNVDRDYFKASLRMKGLSQPWVSARIRSEIDLEKWQRALGIAAFDLKGRYDLDLRAEGQYATSIITKAGVRSVKKDTVISSIPLFMVQSALKNGYLKYASRPEAIKDISFNLDASCSDPDYHHARFFLDNFNASVLGNYVRGFFHLRNAIDFPVEAAVETSFHLSDLEKAYPLDSLSLAGDLSAHIRTYGKYQPSKRLFPVTTADLHLDNGRIQTKYYPHPLEDVKVSAQIVNTGGSLKDLSISLTPISLRFEDQPFMIKADLENFDDLRYNITSRGALDIGRIWQVFAGQGYEVKGMVETGFSLKGKQSDAAAGRYDRLFNTGMLRVKDLEVSAEQFPYPFHIQEGLFRFNQDKMWFDDFHAAYGSSEFTLKGWLSNLIGYLSDAHEPLQGDFSLASSYILLDQFMAFSGSPGQVDSSAQLAARSSQPSLSSSQLAARRSQLPPSGVIIIPDDLSIRLHANVKNVQFNGLEIDDFKGGVTIDSGMVRLDTTAFTLVGAPIEMDASYKNLSAQAARFEYHIGANNFDVHKAYQQIRVFHDLAPSAAKAEGIISLDYRLAGRLNANMRPVYPSLKGGGVITLGKVKVKGLKLFRAVSKETNKDVNDPDLSKVEIKSSINNNIITIERTRMKVSTFKLRMEGQTAFDGRLNLQFRVGLPPFGVIGIPLRITGTQDHPLVKGGKGSKNDALEETEDKEEEGRVD
jgi:AsmA protein